MKYRLRSIFSSIQGEGRHTGRPATFIRFAGCNFNCPWCDTHKHTKAMMTVHEIMAKVHSFKNRTVILTGGEPTVVIGLRDILDALKKDGYWLALETNGARRIPELELFDYVSVSPKYFYRARYAAETMVREADEVRIVAEDALMAGFCRQMRARIVAHDYFISPSAFATEKFTSAFDLKKLHKDDIIIETGYPRNDILYNASENQIAEIKEKLVSNSITKLITSFAKYLYILATK